MHYPGFQILSDDDPRARSHKPTVQRVWNDKDEENVPPPSVPTAPNTGRRIKNFERSKLGSQSVTASSSPPVRRTGKAALKREAEGDAEYEGIVV